MDPHHTRDQPELTEEGDVHWLPLQKKRRPSRRMGRAICIAVVLAICAGSCFADEGQTYAATLVRAIDGDTVKMKVDLGFDVTITQWFRVAGVDTPELKGGTDQSRAAAKRARAFTRKWCADRDITIRLHGDKTFDRWVADLERAGESLADALIETGHGVPANGRSGDRESD